MIKKKHPTWAQWQDQMKVWIAHAVKHAHLTGYRINSAETHKNISVTDPGTSLHAMPYVQISLLGKERGWNERNEGQSNPNSYVYTSIGGEQYLKEQVEMKERIYFQIEVYSNIQKECIEIADAIHRFFLPNVTLIFQWNSADYAVEARFMDMAMEALESDRAGSIEFFRSNIKIQLATTAMTITEDEKIPSVQTVVISITESDSATLEKTQE